MIRGVDGPSSFGRRSLGSASVGVPGVEGLPRMEVPGVKIRYGDEERDGKGDLGDDGRLELRLDVVESSGRSKSCNGRPMLRLG